MGVKDVVDDIKQSIDDKINKFKQDAGLTDPPESKFVQFRISDAPQSTEPQPSFFGAIDKLSNIEALGNATKGLKALSKLSKAGGPKLQKVIDGGATGAADYVLKAASGDKLNAQNTFGFLQKVNPQLLNSTIAQSQTLHEQLKEGRFDEESIPLYTRNFANVIRTGKKFFDALRGKQDDIVQTRKTAPNYAQYLSDVFGGVKTKYRYLVQINFKPEYSFLNEFATGFLAYSCDRPNVEYDNEDVNMYNLRYKVLKKASFQPINMTFYDDQLSNILSFCNAYISLTSPIINNRYREEFRTLDLSGVRDEHGLHIKSPPSIVNTDTLSTSESVSAEGHDNDANASSNQPSQTTSNTISGSIDVLNPQFFDGGTIKATSATGGIPVEKYNASLGAFRDDSQSVIDSIYIYHFYQGGAFCDMYELILPKLLQIQMDGLDSSESAGNSITLNWEYRAFNIQTYMSTQNVLDKLIYASTKLETLTANIEDGEKKLSTHSSLKQYNTTFQTDKSVLQGMIDREQSSSITEQTNNTA